MTDRLADALAMVEAIIAHEKQTQADITAMKLFIANLPGAEGINIDVLETQILKARKNKELSTVVVKTLREMKMQAQAFGKTRKA